jgi:hypothetical protein
MALSPNYSWAEPDNSSLVKNGAQDIRALGDAIDTSVWNIGFGQAGKNKIINGDFGIWQRGTTFNSIATGTYTADRWSGAFINGTCNVTQQAFTAGTAPVAGYESQYFLRFARTSTAGTADFFGQKIEDVRTFAGQTATISFWAKCSTASANGIIFYLSQNFGSGGSSAIDISPSTTTGSVTTSWTRYSATFTVPTIAGKTIGASNFLAMVFQFPTAHGNVSFDIWGVQVEYGAKATPFETATGTIQGELAACQRYYQVISAYQAGGNAYSTSAAGFIRHFPVTMRIAPTATYPTTLTSAIQVFGTGNVTPTAVATANSTTQAITFNGTGTGAMVTFSLTFWSGSDIALSSEL